MWVPGMGVSGVVYYRERTLLYPSVVAGRTSEATRRPCQPRLDCTHTPSGLDGHAVATAVRPVASLMMQRDRA
jgi:hypothetical protein